MPENCCGCPATDVISATSFFRHRLRTEIMRPIALANQAARPLARAIVRQHRINVLSRTSTPHKRDQPRRMPGRHGRACRRMPICSRVNARLFLRARARHALPPSLRGGIHSSRLAPAPFAFCPLTLLALDVPAVGKHLVIGLDGIGRRLMRRVAGAERKPGQPWQIGRSGSVVSDETVPTDPQVSQVIAAFVRAGRIDMGVVRASSGAYWSVSASRKP